MRVIHGLESDTRVIAVEVAVLDEIFDGIDNSFEQVGLLQSGFKHCRLLAII